MSELMHVEMKAPPIQSVLLIDDNPEHISSVRRVLAQHLCGLTVAHDGGQAHGTYEMLRPDCVITELIVRGESGFELCEWIKMKNNTVPVLVLTEVNLDSARQLAAKVGADGYLTKPFKPDALWGMLTDIRQVVWERTRPGAENANDERLQIRFTCQCGKHYRKRLHDAGKSFVCAVCNERVLIPLISERDRPDFRAAADDASPPEEQFESSPMRHLMIQCVDCATSFHLFSPNGKRIKYCPKCNQRQKGAELQMAKSPLTKAALTTCGRVFAIRAGDNKGKKMLVPEKKIYIGRIRPAQILVPTPDVSRRHCSIKPTPTGLRVKDLGSRTGTFVNGRRIQQSVRLKPGDCIQVGPMTMQLLGREIAEEKQDVRTDIELNDNTSIAEQAAAILGHHWTISRIRRTKSAAKASKAAAQLPPQDRRGQVSQQANA